MIEENVMAKSFVETQQQKLKENEKRVEEALENELAVMAVPGDAASKDELLFTLKLNALQIEAMTLERRRLTMILACSNVIKTLVSAPFDTVEITGSETLSTTESVGTVDNNTPEVVAVVKSK